MSEDRDNTHDLLQKIIDAPEEKTSDIAIELVGSKEPHEVALLLESVPQDQRLELWKEIPQKERLDILLDMRSDPRESILSAMPIEELDELFLEVDAEILIELSESMPNRLVDRALRAMSKQQREFFKNAASYDDEVAGHWINNQLLILPTNAKVRDARRLLRRDWSEYTEVIYLISRTGRFYGLVRIGEVISTPKHVPLVDLVEEETPIIDANEEELTAALKVQQSEYSALPVVDDAGKLIGRLPIDTACEIVNEYYEGQLMATAGMDEDEDLFAPVFRSARSRAVWLGINLLTAFLASWCIGLFEATLQEVVALAVLMPVVASMGGIAGSQTLTLIIRGLALKQVSKANLPALLKKEIGVGALNGVLWAIVIGGVASLWFGSHMLGVVICLAILANIVAAALAGIFVPVLLDKFKLDPALSGSVILTTVTDIVGFVAFLGLGSLLLIQ